MDTGQQQGEGVQDPGARKLLEFVEVDRPRCPDCESPHLRAYKSQECGDGSLMRWTQCQACGKRFVLVLK